MKKLSKSAICIMFSLMLVLVSCMPSFAVYYSNVFPSSETGLTGGGFIVGYSGNTRVVVIIPITWQKDTFTFDTQGGVYNVTNSTITGRIYINGTLYPVRWQAFSGPQYYHQSGAYNQWTDFNLRQVEDTNIEFVTSVRAWQNDSLYLSKKDIAFLSVLISILFFVFLGWFLWHRQRS